MVNFQRESSRIKNHLIIAINRLEKLIKFNYIIHPHINRKTPGAAESQVVQK